MKIISMKIRLIGYNCLVFTSCALSVYTQYVSDTWHGVVANGHVLMTAIQREPGRGPVQPAVGDPALAGGLD